MNAAVKRLRHLGIDLPPETGEATKGSLDVTAGTAKAVVEIEMPKGGVEIVVPHQANHPAAEPDAFRVSSGAIDGLCRFDELVGFTLIVLVGVCRRGACRFARLILGMNVTALGKGTAGTDQKGKPVNGEVA
jgi:hypothetical protein